jgi:hypothetical protein
VPIGAPTVDFLKIVIACGRVRLWKTSGLELRADLMEAR